MKTDNRNSEKDLNANPESTLNTNKPISRPDRFPESQEAAGEIRKEEQREKAKKEDDDVELLANEVKGTVSERSTGSEPGDTAGVADVDRGMRRSRRYRS